MDNISIKKATIINFIGKYSNIIIQLIINSVLARILTPDDYGVVAIINVFIGFFVILADMGIGPAIIQNKKLDEKDIASIFNFTIVVGGIVSVLFCIFSILLSDIYNNKEYINICLILSPSILFNILNMVPNALLLKEKKFKILAIRSIVINIVCGVFTIILALLGTKYYSLIINSVLVAFITFLWNRVTIKIPFIWGINRTSLNKIKSFSTYQFGFNFINYFSRNLDNLLIGKFLGPIPLGYYDKAYRLMLYPVQNLTHVITPVLHPILSDYQNDTERIYEQYIKIVKLLSLLGVFFSAFCFFSAKEIIVIMFGNQWLDSVRIFRILSISIWIHMTLATTGSIFQATGNSKYLFKVGVVNTFIIVSFILIGIWTKDLEKVAVYVVVGYTINFFVSFNVLIKYVFNKKIMSFYRQFITSIIIYGVIFIAYSAISVNSGYILVDFLIKGIIGCCAYIIGLCITKEHKSIIRVIKK